MARPILHVLQEHTHLSYLYPGVDLGGGVEADAPPPSEIRPHADPKGSPFELFWDIHFWLTDPKFFKDAFGANIYLFPITSRIISELLSFLKLIVNAKLLGIPFLFHESERR